jgi:hypothetical protein
MASRTADEIAVTTTELDYDADELLCVPVDAAGQRLLRAMLAEIESFGELAEDVAHSQHVHMLGMRFRGVPYQPCQWFAPLTNAARMAYSRAARRLEDTGWVWRVTEERRDRVTHLQPTEAGLQLALELVPGADRAALARGLRHTTWGHALAERLSGLQVAQYAARDQDRHGLIANGEVTWSEV